MLRSLYLTVILASTTLLLNGCLALSFGGGDAPGTTKHTPTRGEELMDLRAAFESGAIDEDEYDRARSQIIRGQ